MADPNEEDLRVAKEIVTEINSEHGIEPSEAWAIYDNAMVSHIASAIAAEREKTWKDAIEIAKQPINTLGWGSASGGVAQKVIVDSLEVAAGNRPTIEQPVLDKE